jgi:hypothetical protein
MTNWEDYRRGVKLLNILGIEETYELGAGSCAQG